MAFASRFSNTHLLKRGRIVEKYDPDGVYSQRFNAGVENGYKRHCSIKNSVAEFVELDYEEEEDDDMIFTCYQPYLNGVLREETADSETCSSKVYYDSDNFSPPFCRSNSAAAASVLRLPVPEDAQSSTSDSCCCCCCDTSDEDDDEEGDDNEGFFISKFYWEFFSLKS
ncbi:hypothetical protein SUGI_1123130 [Cryptomeria japonica]|nr:hypothetical protein SUGI_1123130 [Cryptomeria japonica]